MGERMPASDCGAANTDTRLAALEELSALDQELELEYGLPGNPLVRVRAGAVDEVTHWMPLPDSPQ